MHSANKTRRTGGRPTFLALAAFFFLAGLPSAGAESVWDKPGVEPYRLPVARHWLNRENITRPHHDHPSWDLNLPTGTRAYSVQAGRVVAVLHSGACGIGIVIDGFDGFRYTYCHGSAALVRANERLHAGEPVMRTGSSGSATNAHLHFQIDTRRDRLKCPQPLILSWWRGGQKTPRQAPFSGCTY
ncbi:MAG: M23 family metallopeptidase [Actinomycetota bacterium]|nr:M23 family metallopeptidase [Actinomycetota bacterium]